jgi:hypothetical protein
LLGLSLAWQLFAAPIPVSATEILERDKSITQISAEIAARLIQPTEENGKVMQLDRLRARSRERLRERLPHYRRMLKHVLTPNEKDREFLPLPQLLFPLYFIIRPIRLLRRQTLNIFHPGKKNTESKTETISG